MNKEQIKIGLGYTLISFLWGSTWLAIRIGLDYLTPFISCGVRFFTASILIYLIMLFRGIKLQTDKKSLLLYLFMGVFSFGIPFGLVYWAEQFVPSGLASVLFAIFPFLVMIFSRILLPESKIGPYQILGTVMGFSGLLIIFSTGLSFDMEFNLWGMLALFISAVMQAFVAVFIKKHGDHLNPFSMNLVPIIIGGIFLTAAGLFYEDLSTLQFAPGALISVFYLAFFGTIVTFTTYFWLLKRINVVILSLSGFINPIIALMLGWIILNEVLGLRELIGSSLVLIGILFANLKGLKNYYNQRKLRLDG